MSQKLWEANSQTKAKSNLFEFENFLAKKFNYLPKKNYKKLFDWTIKYPKLFWSSVWDYSNIKGIKNEKFHFPKEIIKSKFLVKSKKVRIIYCQKMIIQKLLLLLVKMDIEKKSHGKN